MGTAKRERQKAGRDTRRAEAEAAAKKASTRKRAINIGIVVVVAIALIGLWVLLQGGSDKKSTTSTASSSTTTPPSTTAAPTYGTTECPPASGAATVTTKFSSPFKQCIDPAKTYTAVITTTKGELTVTLDAKKAPATVNNFVALARSKFFDNTPCHRIIPNFVVQCGDPTGTGTGGPGYTFRDELPQAGEYKVGSLAMANSGPNTNGSQFFIITGSDGAALPPNYSLFGQVSAGADTSLKALDAAGNPDKASNGVPPKEPVSIVSVKVTES